MQGIAHTVRVITGERKYNNPGDCATNMAKQKYHYDPVTCNYEPVRTSTKDVIFDLLGFLTVALLIASGLFYGYITHFESPQELQLKAENALLKTHYKKLQQKIQDSEKLLAQLHENDNNLYRLILNAEPMPKTMQQAGVGGTDRYADLRNQNTLIAELTEKVDTFGRQLSVQVKSYTDVLNMAKRKEDDLKRLPAVMPIPPGHLKRISDGFGPRLHPVYGVLTMHNGVDLAAKRHTPVITTGDGTVIKVKYSRRAGNFILVDHGKFVTKYCHLHSTDVKQGQKVVRGQRIGTVGTTGASTAPHLHYEVLQKKYYTTRRGRKRIRKKNLDPADYFFNDLSAREYDTLRKLAARKITPTS